MARLDWQVEHVLRRAGFGPDATDFVRFANTSVAAVTAYLVDFEQQPDDVDAKIGDSTYVGVTSRGPFSPNTRIDDARQRWLFRMVHSQRPLQGKMALFWHNHFATTYTKVAGGVGGAQATKMLARKAGELLGPQGQLELFRQFALGNFRDLLVNVARDPAMVVFLDGRTNFKRKPQENFGREILELFTFGVGNYVEEDVYAAARVFTGWNLRRVLNGENSDPNTYFEFFYNPNQHDTTAKTFTFPIYGNDGFTIAERAAADGMQEGYDLITALALHPETARRLARKLWHFFVSELEAPDLAFVEAVATVYLQNNTEMKPVVRYILGSPWFLDQSRVYARYSWPAEFVIRAIREVGWTGFSVNTARTPMTNMGQTLFEPPDVAGWTQGQGWFSTGAMLARVNFAASLASNQRFNVAAAAAPHRANANAFLDFLLQQLSPSPLGTASYNELLAYLSAGGAWTGSDTQLNAKTAGLLKLIVGSANYQFV